MSEEAYSPSAIAAFARDHGRQPSLRQPTDAKWLRGYDTARNDNAAAMKLMDDELRQWRTGERKLAREE